MTSTSPCTVWHVEQSAVAVVQSMRAGSALSWQIAHVVAYVGFSVRYEA
jgi:hypothetical protein